MGLRPPLADFPIIHGIELPMGAGGRGGSEQCFLVLFGGCFVRCSGAVRFQTFGGFVRDHLQTFVFTLFFFCSGAPHGCFVFVRPKSEKRFCFVNGVRFQAWLRLEIDHR